MNSFEPTDGRIFIYGRTVRTSPLPLFWTGSGVEVITDGTEVWFELESWYTMREDWIRIEVDGVCVARQMVPKGKSVICVYRAMLPEKRQIRLLKEVQPARDEPDRFLLFHRVMTDGKLYPAEEKKCRMELIGDSLSSGEGLSGPCSLVGKGGAAFGLEGHYFLRVASKFHADFRILSQSGWGVNSGSDNDIYRVMPPYYCQVCGVLRGETNERLGALQPWDFSQWQPDIILVNLGSNDGFAITEPAWVDPADGREWKLESDADGRLTEGSRKRFEAKVTDFLALLREKNPDAYILWVYGMVDHTVRVYLEEAVEGFRTGRADAKVGFLLLNAMRPEWLGSNHHPNALSHRDAADLIIKRLREATGHQDDLRV